MINKEDDFNTFKFKTKNLPCFWQIDQWIFGW
jgi:hypothetical protein